MNTASGSSLVLRTAVVIALFGSAPLASAADGKDSLALEEIVVTATKVAQDIDSTPAAITAITADALGAGGITEVRDLAYAVPNLSVGDQFGVNRTFIRGIGMTSIDLGADGAVAFLQDGAMIPRPSHQLAGFYDLEQVEVLRGPQGTLYGRGATAGVVNMVTKKPTEDLDGYMNYTLGNYAATTFEGAIGGPLMGDTVMGRISGKADKRDGYGENLATGKPIDNRDAYAVRGSLRFKPSDDLDIVLMADYFKENDYNYAFHYFGTTVVPEDSLPHNALGGKTIFDYYAARGKKADLRNIVSDADPINQRDGTAVTGIIDWKFADGWNLRSITAWRDFDRYLLDDLDSSDVDMFGKNNYIETSESWSQDFTVSGEAIGIEWLMGANYFSEKMHGEVKVPLTNLGLIFGLPADFFDDGNYWQNGDVDVEAYGLFLQGRYAFTDNLALTLGARYNYEKREGTGSFTFDALGVNVPTDREKSWDKVTAKALLEYKTPNDGLAYLQFTQGFKSGVINIGSLNDVIDPEYVDAYEIGYKMSFLDDRASLRAAAFYYDYTDLQVGFVNEQSVVETVNAASAENKGVELELIARLTESLTANVSATWLDATYTEFVTGDYRNNFEPTDLSGNNLQNAPEYTARVALDYVHPLSDTGNIVAGIEASYQDDVYFTEFNNSDAFQEAYTLVNARVGYEGGSGKWNVTGWVRNATDEFIYSNNIITAPLYGSVRVGSLLPPRTYGITLGYNF
ncbi:MAG: TonB-dependent receptor [Gammaproteobacteria bacterium]|nr:TonB-dependent receptor [Gammaproteobacteria bacterium]MDH5175785.1 TonB-dependent receptor [Gammaproteobacteria bacterium]MDH5227137.1 TonB-dependent receptor [Gammaproteobacteria bacterium]